MVRDGVLPRKYVTQTLQLSFSDLPTVVKAYINHAP